MESTAGHSPPLNAVQVSNAGSSSVPPLTAPLSPPTSAAPPPPSSSADAVANSLLTAFKISLEEVESYLVALDARVKCEEEYVRALRHAAEKNKDNEAKLDTRIGSIASSLPGSSNLPGMRRAWKELQSDTLQQIKVRANYIETLRAHTIAPLRNFHDSQERIRRRVKEDLKSSLTAYDDMRHVQLKKARKTYEKACETLETLKQHQQALEDQKTLLAQQHPAGKSADYSRSPPGSDNPHVLAAASQSDGSGHRLSDEQHTRPTSPKRSLSLGKRRLHNKSRPVSSGSGYHQQRTSIDEDSTTAAATAAAQLSTSPPDSSNKKNAGAFFDAFRNKETWDNARKDVAKRTNAILHKMKESGGAGGSGSGSNGGSPLLGGGAGGAALDRDANGSSSGRAGGFLNVGDAGSPLGSSGLHHSASVSSKHAQFAQTLAIKISKAKRESQEADKAYRRAIFDVETLSLRREKTLTAARVSVLDCRRELHLTSSDSWLSLNRNWQVLANAELSLARHCEEVLLALGANGRMEAELAILDSHLPVLGGRGLDDGPVPYVNYWHGECKSLLFGVSLLDYDFARNQRRPPQLGPAPVEAPLIVTKCVDFIEKHALEVPGIYRTSAKHTTVQELCASFEKDEARFQFDPEHDEPAAVAGVLKQWLRELPNSVIPMPWEERLKLTHSLEEQLSNGFAALKGRIRRLPAINQVTLKTIITHLANIAAHSDKNLMHAKNLSVVFGPVLLSDSAETHETTSLAAAMEEDNVCEILITYAHDIFSLEKAGAPMLPSLDTKESRQALAIPVEAQQPQQPQEQQQAAAAYTQGPMVLPALSGTDPLPTSLSADHDGPVATSTADAGPDTPSSDVPLAPPGTSSGLKRSNALSSSNDAETAGARPSLDSESVLSPHSALPAPQPIDLPLPKSDVERQGRVPSDPIA